MERDPRLWKVWIGWLVHIIRTHGTHILDSGSEPRTQKWTADWASRILRGPAAPDNSSGAKTADGERVLSCNPLIGSSQ